MSTSVNDAPGPYTGSRKKSLRFGSFKVALLSLAVGASLQKINACCLYPVRIVVEEADGLVAASAEKSANGSGIVIVIYVETASFG